MNTVISKQVIGDGVKRMDIRAPQIAAKAQAGQYLIAMPREKSPRIVVSIVEASLAKGTLTVVFRVDDPVSGKLDAIAIGESFFALLGPLGRPVLAQKGLTAVCIGYEMGIAQIVSVCRAFKAQGKAIGIMGARTKKTMILESQMRLSCQQLFSMTEDGSWGRKGTVVEALLQVFPSEKVDILYVAGPTMLMQEIIALGQRYKIPTKVLLLPWTIDGIGICGADQVKVSGSYVTLSTDGPEFDGSKVDPKDIETRSKNFYGVR